MQDTLLPRSLSRRRLMLGMGLGAATGLSGLRSAIAASFPSQPLTVIVPWAAGGGGDVVVRMLAATLSKRVGQQIVVENRGGATGTIGSAAAARRRPDGYTLLYATPDSHCIFPHLYNDVPYDTLKDFSCIAPIGYFQFGLAVHPSFPAKDALEFIRLIRESPGKYSYGTWGVGSTAQLIMEDFKIRNDLDVLHVPYQGTAPQLVGLASGQVAAAILPMQITDGYVKDGKIRMLGLGSPERFSELPDLPTLKEQGMDMDLRSPVGFLGPAGIPADILNKLNQEITATVNEPDVRKSLLAQYVLPQTMSAQAYREFFVAEYARWGAIVKNSRVVIN